MDVPGAVVDLSRDALVGQHKSLSDTYDVNSWEVEAWDGV